MRALGSTLFSPSKAPHHEPRSASMSDIVATLGAIVRDELSRRRALELGTVTQLKPKTGDDDDGNHQVNIQLRSGVELQRVPVAVGRLGLSALPNVGDLIIVDFIGGDLNAPVA